MKNNARTRKQIKGVYRKLKGKKREKKQKTEEKRENIKNKMKATEPTLMLLTATPSVAVTLEATLQTETNLELDEDLQNHVRVYPQYDARQSAVPGEHHGLHLEQTQFTSR